MSIAGLTAEPSIPRNINVRCNRLLCDGPLMTGTFSRIFDTTALFDLTGTATGLTFPFYLLLGQTLYYTAGPAITLHVPSVVDFFAGLAASNVPIDAGRCIYFTFINYPAAGAITLDTKPGGIPDPNWSIISSQGDLTIIPNGYVIAPGTRVSFRVIINNNSTGMILSDS